MNNDQFKKAEAGCRATIVKPILLDWE
jgi:hypothetical protein